MEVIIIIILIAIAIELLIIISIAIGFKRFFKDLHNLKIDFGHEKYQELK